MSGGEGETPVQRRLATIMFTDMVGYSALSEQNEPKALKMLERHRTLLRVFFGVHGGREVKTVADGFLVEFPSPTEAVLCALGIQRRIAELHAAEPKDDLFAIRIGIHMGEVVVQDGDLLGNGVNVASRIEQIAESGGICISGDVARQIRNKVPVEIESMGVPDLKNISEPLEVFRVVVHSDAPSEPKSVSHKASVAVLPFANMSADPENEYFSDGLTEDIITQISRISALKVISRTSAMQYKNTTKKIPTIGRELGVTTVLEGSVRKIGNRVRITAQLIDAAGDEHLWAENYDRELSDIFAVQSEVAEKIAESLKATMTPAERQRIERKPTENLEAYQLYLQGRFYWGKRTDDSLRRGIECFEKAIALDPNYGEAYAGLADCCTSQALFEFEPAATAFPKARAAAEQAIALHPDMAEAHASLGLVHFQHDWDWDRSERELLIAIELNPNYALGHLFYADLLKGMGRFDEALVQIQTARELDPLSLAINSGVGHVLYLSRRFDEAIAAYRHVLELDPNFIQGRLWFGRPFLQQERYGEAIAELKQAVELSGGSTISLAVLAHAFASAGETASALEILAMLQERAQTKYVPCYWIGLIYVGLGDKDQAFEWLGKACDERSAWLPWIKVEPRFDSLRDDPRFDALMKRIGWN